MPGDIGTSITALDGDIVLIMTIRGTHGTSGSRAKVILSNGFDLDKCGDTRYNRGVYLWDYGHPLKIQLAEDWHSKQKQRRVYDGEREQGCTVLICKLDIDEDELLDMETLAFKNKLHQLVAGQSIKDMNHEVIRSIYEIVVKTIEKILESKFKVLSVRVPPPDKYRYPIGLYGSPFCFIVRDTAGIKIAENV